MKRFEARCPRMRAHAGRLHPRGFSLLELMIAMVLGLLLSLAVYGLLATSGRISATQSALSLLQENGRVAIDLITQDLRAAGHLPCGARIAPRVFVDDLPQHVTGSPMNAAAPSSAVSGQPYELDRGIFLSGSTCSRTACAPVPPSALGVPRAGTASGDKVPGTDVLTVRYVLDGGVPAHAATSAGTCTGTEPLAAVNSAELAPKGFPPGHLALLSSCSAAYVFSVEPDGSSSVELAAGARGVPACRAIGSQPRLFDFDAALQTSTYYLQLATGETTPSRNIATLMRRTNGVVNEVVQGVERLDLRYSLRDRDGFAYWFSARDLDGLQAGSKPPMCGMGTAAHACSWADVDAVDVALLLNSIDDLPQEGGSKAWNYRYSIDGENEQEPGATMPVTGLPAGRMLRREFRTVVALRSMGT